MMIESTTRTHTGKTPMPGMASATRPGKRAHRRPRIRNRANAVARSSAHWKGGANVSQMERTSETAATPKAMAIFAREWRLMGVVASACVRMMGLPVSMEWLSTLNDNLYDSLKTIVPRLLPICKPGSLFHELSTRTSESGASGNRVLLSFSYRPYLIGGSTMRHKVLGRYLMIVSVLALIGCRNSATSPDSTVSPNGNAGNAAVASEAN